MTESFALNRRQLMSGAVMLASATATPLRAADAAIVVETNAGRLRGARRNGVCAFLGVPYGAPTDGHRPAMMVSARSWSGCTAACWRPGRDQPP